jgi:hypothetical protein
MIGALLSWVLGGCVLTESNNSVVPPFFVTTPWSEPDRPRRYYAGSFDAVPIVFVSLSEGKAECQITPPAGWKTTSAAATAIEGPGATLVVFTVSCTEWRGISFEIHGSGGEQVDTGIVLGPVPDRH